MSIIPLIKFEKNKKIKQIVVTLLASSAGF